MLFPTTVFALFFAVVFFLHWGLVPFPRLRKVTLLGASLFFYGYWSWKFAVMLAVSGALNHAAAVWMERARDERTRQRLIVLAVAANLLVLGIFKYTGFLFTRLAVPLAVPLCAHFGTTGQLIALQERVLPFIERIVLPVGISFYTFQALSYVVDVYRRHTPAAGSVLDFVNYLAFFPQLVAGPIVRASDLLPQMAVFPDRSARLDTGRAATLILGGLFKKMVIANWLAQHLADPVFALPETFGAPDVLLGVYAYALQIYCDFSAYSDIAIGCALLLGFHFPLNFHAPYFAVTLQEFWRRWHISLSSWLRDYLYIPLGGSRAGAFRTRANLLITFVLGGLWHGAGWTFVLWGTFHGVYLSLERLVRRACGLPEKPPDRTPRALALLGRLWIFHVVCFSWILFRSPNLEGVREILTGLTRWGESPRLVSVTALAVLAAGFLMQFTDGTRPRRVWNAVNRWPLWVQAGVAALLLTAILGIGPTGVAPFIYFQF
ncbi:MAG: MBOAT family protein [Kiritimatiellia bacterium]|jgi:D-alanyl-lipoteichoic acid acyltransferase DltB (MBOAT superfamily)|nr:MBOAT family protein [Kiritimatiellia bacterium]